MLAAGPNDADRQWAAAKEHYRALGADARLVRALDRRDATPDRLPDADVVFVGGGDPGRLVSALAGTPMWEEILDRWRGGVALGGSSAGAMALCRDCLLPEPGASLPTRWNRGLGPLEGVALAVHADTHPATWLDDVVRRAPCPVLAMVERSGLLLEAGVTPAGIRPEGIRRA
ncbi:MAG TPA: Type 1 glutamine amidotransferase-like domain-containing protein [Actinomycetota bacterium]